MDKIVLILAITLILAFIGIHITISDLEKRVGKIEEPLRKR